MAILKRALGCGLMLLAGLVMVSCGGSSGSGSAGTTTTTQASNQLAVTVNAGPNGNAINTLYTTVTLCVPGTSTCQTIDNIQVDTGSWGLRVLASVLTLSLPVSTATDGNSLVECTTFVDGYSWGPVALADLQVAGEKASSLPVQVIGSSSFTVVPPDCSSTGSAEDTVTTFGANGILGIGVFEQDCGEGCAENAQSGYYYSCTATDCKAIAVPLQSQVLNPIPLFATDNNGSIIELSSVAAGGAATASGSVFFGIDTESNNASSGQTVLTLDPDNGYFTTTTTFNAAPLTGSFIDSGSNGLFFNDIDESTNQSAIALCKSTDFSGFYCPTSTTSLSATLTGQSGTSATVSFSVENAETILNANPTYTAFSTLGGQYSSTSDTFDWGLPFFYGRNVYNAIENHTTAAGTGPYVAF
jgi:Protein of unknown function (DUF3443)